jgi:hypothetical protein
MWVDGVVDTAVLSSRTDTVLQAGFNHGLGDGDETIGDAGGCPFECDEQAVHRVPIVLIETPAMDGV